MIQVEHYQEALDQFVRHGGNVRRTETEVQLSYRVDPRGTVAPPRFVTPRYLVPGTRTYGASVDMTQPRADLVLAAALERGLRQMACACVCGGMQVRSDSEPVTGFAHCEIHGVGQ